MASNRKFNVPINLLSMASDPASADEGDIYYNTTDDRIRVYKNSTWVNLAYADDVGIVSTDYITFDTTPEATIPTTQGTLSWDSGESGLNLTANSNVDLHLGQQNVVLVKNATGASIPKGSVVYINGAAGQRPTIALSDADTEATSSKTLGLTAETIADAAEGFVTTFGVQRGVNTLGMTEGASVWLSSTAGAFTTTIPAEPAHSVFIGYVVKASASAGEVFVNPQNGYELTELHGVTIDGTPADNEVLAYDTTSGLWINQTSAEAGLISGVGTAKVSYQTSAPSSPTTGDIWIDSDAVGSGTALGDLADVIITSNTTGEILVWNGTNWINETLQEAGAAPALSMVSTYYYTAPASNSSTSVTEDVIYFLPLIVPETTTFDRIACRSGSTHAGTSIVRLGIYSDSVGKPNSLILDAGTISVTTSNTSYEITISQTLSAGIYWLAFNSQTNGTTPNFRTSITAYYQTFNTSTAGGGQLIGWTQNSVTGAFPSTAVTNGTSGNSPTVWLRKA